MTVKDYAEESHKDVKSILQICKDNDINQDDVLDPRTKESMLDITITIYVKNNRAYAKVNV